MPKLSISEVRHIIDSEGIGYAVKDYISADEIADQELAELWKIARCSLEAVEEYLCEADESEASDD